MTMMLNGTTKILGIIGHPVKHSLSPRMQNAALSACGLDYVYIPFDVSPQDLGLAISGMKALGVAGFNVTIPHKTAVMACLDELDESAETAGAVNTVKNDNGRLIGYNTDGTGLIRSLEVDLDFVSRGKTIVVIGSGGAARGAVAALCRAGAKKIIIVNRTSDRAKELAALMSSRFPSSDCIVLPGFESLSTVLSGSDLLLNTTSVGMNNESIPYVSFDCGSQALKVYDMIYSPSTTPLLKDAAKAGFVGANGIGMLAAQGELAFAIWTGQDPPSGLMKSTLEVICNT
jgi:shikimate dehydrogenase